MNIFPENNNSQSLERKDSNDSSNHEIPPSPSSLDSSIISPPPSKKKAITYIDKITMECMMNKKHYKNYLEKTNPIKLENCRNLQNKIVKNSIFIENIFDILLENSKKTIHGEKVKYNNKIQDAFNDFIEHSLKYVESNQEEELGEENYEENTGDPELKALDRKLKHDYGENYENDYKDNNYYKKDNTDKKIEKRPAFFTPTPFNSKKQFS